MNVFEAVHSEVTAAKAAEYCGITISRNGMARCPFHDDRTPSMKIDDFYYCFGCGAHGDSIDFFSSYFDCSKLEAAIQLANIFHIPYDSMEYSRSEGINRKYIRKKSDLQIRKERAQAFWRDLTNCHDQLQNDISMYAPKLLSDGSVSCDDQYTKAVHQLPFIEYLMDSYLAGNTDEQDEIMKTSRGLLETLKADHKT